jgi:hypothetical protein
LQGNGSQAMPTTRAIPAVHNKWLPIIPLLAPVSLDLVRMQDILSIDESHHLHVIISKRTRGTRFLFLSSDSQHSLTISPNPRATPGTMRCHDRSLSAWKAVKRT